MKKVLLLIAMVVTGYNVFAFTTQGVWRWRNDDGSETTATWRAAQNTPITITNTDSIIRLRIELYTPIGAPFNGDITNAKFEDSIPGIPGWDTIKLAANSNAFQLAGTNIYVTNLEPTTHQLNGQSIPPFTFVPGKEIVSNDTIPKQIIIAGQTTEFEWAIKPTSNIKPGTTYYFRVDATDSTSSGYNYPSLTTASVLAVNFSAFNLKQDKGQVLITWATASEQNNSHFDIERSANGTVFTKIATVKGNNNSAAANSYSVYDTKPLNGTNYYRLKQVDNDGKVTTSVVKSINISALAGVKAYPNPTHGDINFTLPNNNGAAITATLTNVAGKVVHQEVIQTNTAVSNYKLNVTTKLPAGMYVLQLKGGSVSETVKISVQ